jgi:hypothetical protein
VSSVLTLLVTAAAVLSGLKFPEDSRREYWSGAVASAYVSFLVLGLVAGAVGGLFARTHNWFGPSLEEVLKQWSGPDKLSQREVTMRLFDIAFPPVGQEKTIEGGSKEKQVQTSPATGVLFGATKDECDYLQQAPESTLKNAMVASSRPAFRTIANNISDINALREIVDESCLKQP